MIAKKPKFWLSVGAVALLLSGGYLVFSPQTGVRATPTFEAIAAKADRAAAPLPPGAAVDVVRVAAEVQQKLKAIAAENDPDKRRGMLAELVRSHRGLAAPAIPFLTAMLADRGSPPGPAGSRKDAGIPPRLEATALLGDIGTDEAAALLIRALQEDLSRSDTGELAALLSALGATRTYRAAVELGRLLVQYQDQPGEVRDRLVDFFVRFRLRNWPVPAVCALVEDTRPVWEALVLDPDPFGPSFAARDLLQEQLLTLIGLLRRRDLGGDEEAQVLDLLRRISGRNLPSDPSAWVAWYREAQS